VGENKTRHKGISKVANLFLLPKEETVGKKKEKRKEKCAKKEWKTDVCKKIYTVFFVVASYSSISYTQKTAKKYGFDI